jgi:hypothetical protein
LGYVVGDGPAEIVEELSHRNKDGMFNYPALRQLQQVQAAFEKT